MCCCFCFFKQKTAYEMRISDWSSDVCSSDLDDRFQCFLDADPGLGAGEHRVVGGQADDILDLGLHLVDIGGGQVDLVDHRHDLMVMLDRLIDVRSEEHTSELQSLMRISYAVFCLKKKQTH